MQVRCFMHPNSYLLKYLITFPYQFYCLTFVMKTFPSLVPFAVPTHQFDFTHDVFERDCCRHVCVRHKAAGGGARTL